MVKWLASVLLVFASLPALAGTYEGVGMIIQKTDQGIRISQVIPGGPAARAGLIAGGFIKEVNGASIEGQSLNKVVSSIRGPSNTTVNLTLSGDDQQTQSVTLTRESITLAPCVLEGEVNLITNSSDPQKIPPTLLTGTIGTTPISWTIAGNVVVAQIDGQSYSLYFQTNGFQSLITGIIRGASVNWYGTANVITGYQSCIQ